MGGNIIKNTTCLEKMLYSKNETTCFGVYWPSSGFHSTLRRAYKFVKACWWRDMHLRRDLVQG
jgi:hypothetical protein